MRRNFAPVVLLAAGLALSGCAATAPSSDVETRAAVEGTDAAPAPDPATWPLTGLPAAGDRAATDHPVLVLKMDNTTSSAPQRGLSSADLVVEEMVEGGVTRLAAFYYSDIPGAVGPVRSMRASDLGIVAPVGATMVTSGAAQQTLTRVSGAGIRYVTEGSPGFFRDSARSAPYDLMADLGEVADASRVNGAPVRPPDYLPFGSEDDLPEGEPVTSFAARFSGAHATSWTYRDGRYVDTGSLAADGDEFPADTVLVLRVRVGDAGYLDPAGNTVPETRLVGEGEAMLFHSGRLVRGTWTKTALDAPLTLSRKTPDGERVALSVPSGRTWIELVPLSGGVDLAP